MVIILGRTGAGKSTLQDYLINHYSMQKLTSYTSRPRRENESESEYHFISKNKFEQFIEQNFFTEYTKYHVAVDNADWYYGTSIQDVRNAKSNTVTILNPDGLQQIQKYVDKSHILSIYIDVLPNILKQRLSQRGDNPEEVERRIRADSIDFADINFQADRIVFNNDSVQACAGKMVEILQDKGIIGENIP